MSMEHQRGSFPTSDIIKVAPPKRPCVLNSGGPVMELLSISEGVALCEWRDDDGKIGRGRFSLNCLYLCTPMKDAR